MNEESVPGNYRAVITTKDGHVFHVGAFHTAKEAGTYARAAAKGDPEVALIGVQYRDEEGSWRHLWSIRYGQDGEQDIGPDRAPDQGQSGMTLPGVLVSLWLLACLAATVVMVIP